MTATSQSSVALAAVILALLSAHSVFAQTSREDMVVQQSTAVLNEIMAIPARGIPHSLLARAEGVVIIPNMIKGASLSVCVMAGVLCLLEMKIVAGSLRSL